MSSPSVVLYNPQSSASRKPVLPMALLALGALLEGEFEYRIVDGNISTHEDLRRAVHESGAGIVGMTVMGGPQLKHAATAARKLRRTDPEVTIVWGGYFPTQHADTCLGSDCVDIVVSGHGEQSFLALLRAIRDGGDRSSIPGIREAAKDSGHVAPAPIPRPDQMPDFPYHRVPVERYVRKTFMGRRTLPHHSSYGCPFRCNFCAVVNMVDGRWLAQSAERTAQVVETLVERYRVDAVEFYDNNFFVNEKRTAVFAERIASHGIGWWGEARVDTLLKYDDATWRLMRDSGLKMVFLGAESGSNDTLRRMNKGGKASAEKTLEIAAKMRSYGIVPEFSFVLGNPPDPEQDVTETLRFVRRLKAINPIAETIFYMYTPVPLAGDLYDSALENGFRFPETLDEWMGDDWQNFAQRRSSFVPWIGDPLHRRVRNFERVVNAFYPTATDPNLGAMTRRMLRWLSGWRYRLGIYAMPVELRAAQKLVHYQRPETTGF